MPDKGGGSFVDFGTPSLPPSRLISFSFSLLLALSFPLSLFLSFPLSILLFCSLSLSLLSLSLSLSLSLPLSIYLPQATGKAKIPLPAIPARDAGVPRYIRNTLVQAPEVNPKA